MCLHKRKNKTINLDFSPTVFFTFRTIKFYGPYCKQRHIPHLDELAWERQNPFFLRDTWVDCFECHQGGTRMPHKRGGAVFNSGSGSTGRPLHWINESARSFKSIFAGRVVINKCLNLGERCRNNKLQSWLPRKQTLHSWVDLSSGSLKNTHLYDTSLNSFSFHLGLLRKK